MNISHPLHKYLSAKNGEVAELITTARQLARLEKVILQALPQTLREHVRVSGIRQQTLVLVTDSPAWQHKIRYLSSEIIAKIKQYQSGYQLLDKVSVLIDPDFGHKKPDPTPEQRAISDDSINIIRSMAESLPDSESELREALQQLASHASAKKPK